MGRRPEPDRAIRPRIGSRRRLIAVFVPGILPTDDLNGPLVVRDRLGRAAMGRPWLFREIEHFLATGEHLPAPEVREIHRVLVAHLNDLYAFYGEHTGVRIARKHISWYTKGLAGSAAFRHHMNTLASCDEQLAAVNRFFEELAGRDRRLRYEEEQEMELAA